LAPRLAAGAFVGVGTIKRPERPGPRSMLTIILIVVVLLLLFGGFGYSRRGRRL
jgi:hypothetical protein